MNKVMTLSLVLVAFSTQIAVAKDYLIRTTFDEESGRMHFEPKHLEIASGDTVIWVNSTDIEHNIVSYPDGHPSGSQAMSSPYIEAEGERWSYTFTVSGTYEYLCMPHYLLGMHGSIVVDRPSTNEEFHIPSKVEQEAFLHRMLEFFDEEELGNLSKSPASK